jgi:hypothetical protein
MVDLHPTLSSLRETLTKGFEREGGGGDGTGQYRARICPACERDRRGEHFVGGICDRCFREGKPLPEKEKITMEPQVTPEVQVKQQRTYKVNQKRIPCPKCGKVMPPGPLALHARRCKERPAAVGDPPVEMGKRAVRARPIAPLMLMSSKPLRGCADCHFRGLDSAIARELLQDAIRGGMSMETAPGFVRRVVEMGR